ncbi:MAG: NfeD family protein [Desulfobulbus sp.]|jgi:membrane protein implicated in regulation of membrane protease activity|nr:NfeD family protein [Desulfobulbus sp.]
MSLSAVSPVLAWFLLGILLFALELALPGMIVFFFGVGAWCAALAVFLLPLSLAGQLLVFLVTSLVALVLLRATVKKVFLGGKLEVDALEQSIPAGATGVVIEDIVPPAAGKIKYGGSFWRATADRPIRVGTVVTIVEKNNLSIRVRVAGPEGEA